MDNCQAAFDSFDGVELRFLNDVVVRCEALKLQEAVRLLRLTAGMEERPENHWAFISEFPTRIGVMDLALVDIGLVVLAPGGHAVELNEVTVREGLELAEAVVTALADAHAAESSKAKIRVLDEFPDLFGLPEGLSPAEVFTVARSFTRSLYDLMYGLARDFSSHLTSGPEVKVMTMMRAPSQSRG